MPRAIWNGHLAFGLVQIPVGLFPAEARDELDFDLLDRRDHAPIGYSKVNKKTGKEVPAAQIVKGFAIQPGHYVIVTDEDFRRATVESTHTVDISEFVAASDIDPVYFERPYYVAPTKGGARPYRLLLTALRESKRVGIGRVVLRTRECVAALYALGDVLVLNTLRYAHELRDRSDLEIPRSERPAPRELAMAKKLIDEMEGSWRPAAFKDRYRDDLLKVIRRKAKSGERGLPPPLPEKPKSGGGKVIDLAALLKRSLTERHGGRKASDEEPRSVRRRSA